MFSLFGCSFVVVGFLVCVVFFFFLLITIYKYNCNYILFQLLNHSYLNPEIRFFLFYFQFFSPSYQNEGGISEQMCETLLPAGVKPQQAVEKH